jgi:muramoyltetrapeptide carboxypeptidase LdcA involved in peptidoglycan recycling
MTSVLAAVAYFNLSPIVSEWIASKCSYSQLRQYFQQNFSNPNDATVIDERGGTNSMRLLQAVEGRAAELAGQGERGFCQICF